MADEITSKEDLKKEFENNKKPDEIAFHSWMDLTLFQEEDGIKRLQDNSGKNLAINIEAGENNEVLLFTEKGGTQQIALNFEDDTANINIATDPNGTKKVAISGEGKITADKIEAKDGMVVSGGNVSIEAGALQVKNGDSNAFDIDSSGNLQVSGNIVSTGAEATLKVGTAKEGYPIPQGGIIMWSGTTANIPAGWRLCNGLHGTPDLRGKFIVGRTDDTDDRGNSEANLSFYKGTGGTVTVDGKTMSDRAGGQREITLTENNIPEHDHIKEGSIKDGKLKVAEDGGHRHLVARNETQDVETAVSSANTIAHHTNVHDREEYLFQAVSGEPNVGRTSPEAAHQHEVDFLESFGAATVDKIDNRPPYYVLAFIMKT